MLGTSDALNNYLVTWPCYKVVIITHYSFQMQSGKIPEPNQHSERQRVKGGAPSENQSERFSLPEKHFILNNCPVKPQGCPLVRAEAPAQSSKWAHRDLLHLRVQWALVKHEIVIIIRLLASTQLQTLSKPGMTASTTRSMTNSPWPPEHAAGLDMTQPLHVQGSCVTQSRWDGTAFGFHCSEFLIF